MIKSGSRIWQVVARRNGCDLGTWLVAKDRGPYALLNGVPIEIILMSRSRIGMKRKAQIWMNLHLVHIFLLSFLAEMSDGAKTCPGCC